MPGSAAGPQASESVRVVRPRPGYRDRAHARSAVMGGLAARDVRLATRPEGSLWPMAGSERSSRGPRKVLLPMSASLGSCSVAQPGSWCRGFARALPRASLRGARRPRRRPAAPDCCCGNVAPSSTATLTGCPPSRTYELAGDPRTAAGHAVAVCEPAGAEDTAAGKRHSDRHHPIEPARTAPAWPPP